MLEVGSMHQREDMLRAPSPNSRGEVRLTDAHEHARAEPNGIKNRPRPSQAGLICGTSGNEVIMALAGDPEPPSQSPC